MVYLLLLRRHGNQNDEAIVQVLPWPMGFSTSARSFWIPVASCKYF